MSTVPKKLFNLVILLPLAIVLIVLCVANRQVVTLALNPFQPTDSLLAFTAPFFVFLFLSLILGVILGSFVTWISQSTYRTYAKRKMKDDQHLPHAVSVREQELERELEVYRRQALSNSALVRS
jgi:uncharacterized integral membrane protein